VIHTVLPSPIGELLLVSDGVAVTGLYPASHVRRPTLQGEATSAATGVLAQARDELAEYFDGRRSQFDVPLAPVGTEFQRLVWDRLREIPYGERASYRDIAEAIGAPRAVRAVGAANGRNPISIIVPCHRVIGSNGSLTGYAGGLATKQWLLAFETCTAVTRLELLVSSARPAVGRL
jgi:methylated-DNA-[protein]-cysteine S-methyltransferase